jgi:hypothetical protein
MAWMFFGITGSGAAGVGMRGGAGFAFSGEAIGKISSGVADSG